MCALIIQVNSLWSLCPGGSWGPPPPTAPCVCLKCCCPPVTRQAGGVGGRPGRAAPGGGRVRRAKRGRGCGGRSSSLWHFPGVGRNTSHVKAVTFAGWEPHGARQARGYAHSWLSLGGGATQRQFTRGGTLTWLCMPVTRAQPCAGLSREGLLRASV